ncbi:MAG: 2-aminoethylphosphonate--pyruvate transaminase [bacterium]|nr:2-aminoethylphosphonate--pyruvate transaminase [bacterium]
MSERMVLLNPGPANTTQSVKDAQLAPDVCPRETHFGDVMGDVAERLARLVDPTGEVVCVLFGGSGTSGVEAAVASAMPADGRLLVLDNGAYGARIADIAAAYALPHKTLRFGIGEPLDLEAIEAELDAEPFTQCAVIHHETTTGMLNPVAEVGALCQARDVELIVDAMSSFAGIPLTMDGLHADFLVSSSNKCIQGMAGLSFVFARRARIEAMEPVPGRSLYLNVGQQFRFFEAQHQMRFTPPVQTVYALAQAIDELEAEGGVAARRERYDACWRALDGGVRELGFRPLLQNEQQSRILTAYVEPDHAAYSYDALHDHLYARGFTIYPGKGAKVGTFRLANMGDVTVEDMQRFARALGETVEAMGIRPLYGG